MESEILRKGNGEVLDDIKEGIFIMDEDELVVVFQNEQAKKFEMQMNEGFSLRELDTYLPKEVGGERFNIN